MWHYFYPGKYQQAFWVLMIIPQSKSIKLYMEDIFEGWHLRVLLERKIQSHSPQTSPSAARHVCMWEWRWAQPACRCSRNWVALPPLLPIHQPPGVEQTARTEPAPSPQHGSGPPPAYGWRPPRSPHYWSESESRSREKGKKVRGRDRENQLSRFVCLFLT